MAATDNEKVAGFKSWLISKGRSPSTANTYAYAIAKSLEDPERALRTAKTRSTYKPIRAAWRLMAKYLGKPEIWAALRDIEGPRASKPRPKPIPSEGEWIDIAHSVWKTPGNPAAVCWIILWSSLRISDVLRIPQQSVFDALARGQTIIFQKGLGGDNERLWVPGPLAMLGLRRLAPDLQSIVRANGPDIALWQLCSASQDAAESKIRNLIPKPFTPHTFRRAFISYAVQQKMPITTIAACTGHADLSSLQVYINRNIAVPPSEAYAAQDELVRHIVAMAAGRGRKVGGK